MIKPQTYSNQDIGVYEASGVIQYRVQIVTDRFGNEGVGLSKWIRYRQDNEWKPSKCVLLSYEQWKDKIIPLILKACDNRPDIAKD